MTENYFYEVFNNYEEIKYYQTFEKGEESLEGNGRVYRRRVYYPLDALPFNPQVNPMDMDGYEFLEWAAKASIEELEAFSQPEAKPRGVFPRFFGKQRVAA